MTRKQALRKLARAMAQGIKKTRCTTGALTRKRGNTIYACALGAALVNGYSPATQHALDEEGKGYSALLKRFPVLKWRSPDDFDNLQGAIITRNDAYRWRRTRIVAWLRDLARKQP